MSGFPARTQLFCILARNGSTAVIFRRGPSKRVLLIQWDRRADSFVVGQWLKGRIYERRSDLSPKGDKLIYFAAAWKPNREHDTWTAISKPPYLSAITLWPKGDAWGGGGLFETDNTIRLNHMHGDPNFGKRHGLGKRIRVKPLGNYSGGGEDDPIYHYRLLRDGWRLAREDLRSEQRARETAQTQPRIYERASPLSESGFALQMRIKGTGMRNQPHYLIDHVVLRPDGGAILELPETSWADWDSSGDLLYAREGKLFRLPFRKPQKRNGGSLHASAARELADFSDLAFRAKAPPRGALRW